MHLRTILACITCALAIVAGAQPSSADGLRLETGALTALNSTQDLGASLSIGAELPKWVPVIGEHLGFIDLLKAANTEAIGLSVGLQRAETDDGWRVGATVTQPTDGGTREVLGYVRFGVGIKF